VIILKRLIAAIIISIISIFSFTACGMVKDAADGAEEMMTDAANGAEEMMTDASKGVSEAVSDVVDDNNGRVDDNDGIIGNDDKENTND
jgi:hypothetical protein